MKKGKDTKTLILAGKEVTFSKMPAGDVHAANKRISERMGVVSRAYKVKAANSKRYLAKTVLNA